MEFDEEVNASSPTQSQTNAAQAAHALHLPIARVKRIMKEDHDVDKVANDAVVAVASAAQAFLAQFSQRASQRMHQDKRKTLNYKDLSGCCYRCSFIVHECRWDGTGSGSLCIS